jgi:hypothetical protein
MCNEIVACPTCGEWLDEFSASSHECKIAKKEVVFEKPIEVALSKKIRK